MPVTSTRSVAIERFSHIHSSSTRGFVTQHTNNYEASRPTYTEEVMNEIIRCTVARAAQMELIITRIMSISFMATLPESEKAAV